MQTTTSDYDTAVTATVRQSVAALTVDWDDDGDFSDAIDDVTRYVKSITVDRALTTDLPEQARLVTGYSAAKLTAQLGGDPRDLSKTASAVWSPYSSGSDYYGKTRIGANVIAKLGLNTESGDELFTLLTGKVTKISLSRGQATATLEALDGAESLRSAVHLPQMISSDPTDVLFQPGLNSQHIIERILATGGYHAVPAARSDAVLAATFHGSVYPVVGTLTQASFSGANTATPIPFVQGKFGLAMKGNTAADYDLDGEPTLDSGTALFAEMWVTRPGSSNAHVLMQNGSDDTDGRFAEISVDNSGVFKLSTRRGAVGLNSVVSCSDTVPDDADLHYVAVYAAFGATSVSIQFNVDGSITTATGTLDAATVGTSTAWTAAVEVPADCLIEGLQVSSGVQSTVQWHDDWTPTAKLEPGLSEVTAVPATDADDAWALLQEVVGAEAGVIRFDGSGVAVFWNRQHWRKDTTANTVQRTLTATDSILDLTTVELADAVRNRIRIPVSPLTVSDTQVVWQQSDVVSVPAKGERTIWARPQSGQFFGLDTTGWVIPEGGPLGTNGDDKSGYRAARNKDGSGGQISNLTMTITAFADTAKIVFTNPNAFDAWLVSPHGGVSPNGGSTYPTTSDGKPAVALVGKLISGQQTPVDTTTVDPTLGDAGVFAEAALPGLTGDTERVYTAPTTPWRQDLASAQSMADDLLRALHRPVPQVQGLSIVADPSLELGDRVQIKDTAGTKLDDPFWIVGITTTYNATDGMTQTVTLRPVAAPGQFIFGVTGRNLVGTTPL